MAVATEAATLAPSQPTTGDYAFLSIPWGTPRADVRARLEARGFTFIETDADGDDQFQGRVDGRDAGLAAMYAGSGLAKFVVVMLAADPNGGLLEAFKQNLGGAYGTPAEQRGVATIWPERTGTLVWITTSEARNVTVHYEAAGWPAESKRQEGRRDRVLRGIVAQAFRPAEGLRSCADSLRRYIAAGFVSAIPQMAGGDRSCGSCQSGAYAAASGRPSPRPTPNLTALAARLRSCGRAARPGRAAR